MRLFLNTTIGGQLIQLGARQDASGTTDIFTGCLANFYSNWTDTYPSNFTTWTATPALRARSSASNFHLIPQNIGVAGFVVAVSYSLGYVAYPTLAQQNIFNVASMVNANGDILAVTSDNPPNLLTALGQATYDSNFVTNSLINSPLPGAWPMGGPTYIIIRPPTTESECAQKRELLLFINWALTSENPQANVLFAGYSSLGTQMTNDVIYKLANLTCPGTNSTIMAYQSLTQHPGRGYGALLAVSLVVGGLVVTLAVVYLIIRRHFIPAAAYFFFAALLVGSLLNYLSIIWFYLVPTHSYICQLRQWFVALGFSLMYAGLFVRASQIRAIYRLSKSSKILVSQGRQMKSMLMLLVTFVAIILVQVILLTVWSGSDEWGSQMNQVDDLRRQFTYYCTSKRSWIWFGLEIAYFGVMLTFGLIVVYRTWDMKLLVTESKWIAISIYNSIVTAGITVTLLSTLSTDDNVLFWVASGAIFFLTTTTMIALFVPKFFSLRSPESSSTTSKTTASRASKSDSKGSL